MGSVVEWDLKESEFKRQLRYYAQFRTITPEKATKTQYLHIYQSLRSGRIWHKVNF